MATSASSSQSVPLLDEHDPPSPITVVVNDGDIQIEGVLVDKFAHSQVVQIDGYFEQGEPSFVILSDQLETVEESQGHQSSTHLTPSHTGSESEDELIRPPCDCTPPSPSDISSYSQHKAACIVSTGFEDACKLLFFFRDNIKYYGDLRSFHPVARHAQIYRQEFQLFCFMQGQLGFGIRSLPPNSKCLEIGCGAGHWAKAFAHENPLIQVLGVDSTCFGSRTDNDPLNYQFSVIDLANLSAPSPSTIPIETYDYIRCTRLNTRVYNWWNSCRIMYSCANNGASVEIYDVLADSAIDEQRQPTWATAQWRKHCCQMRHMPSIPGREWAEPYEIVKHLKSVGFARIQVTSIETHLDVEDDIAAQHIERLTVEAVDMAHLFGMSLQESVAYYERLKREAHQHGLKVNSFTIYAEKLKSE